MGKTYDCTCTRLHTPYHMSKTLCFPLVANSFLIYSLNPTFIINLIKCSITLYSTFFYFSSFMLVLSVLHVPVTCYTHLIVERTNIYKCFFCFQCNKKYSRRYNFVYPLCIYSLTPIFAKSTCLTFSSEILLIYANSNWLYFLYSLILAL